MRRYVAPVALATLLALAAGCSSSDGGGGEDGRGGSEAGPAPTGSATDTPSSVPSSVPSSEAAPLRWSDLPGPVEDTVTTNGDWTLTVAEDGTSATLDGPGGAEDVAVSARERVGEALLDERWAVVVLQDRQESRPARALVTDLDSGEELEIGADSAVPTTTGGTWAMGAGTLVHATVTPRGQYCLATVDLATGSSRLGWCAPERHGFNGARVTDAGVSVMTFDDAQPSCRTLVRVEGREATPLEDVTACKGWDALALAGAAVWSEVPKENNVEAATLHARTDGGEVLDLGPGTSGTLVGCGDTAWFVRDPQRDGEPARLMRWSPDAGLSAAYETAGTPAFLAAPRCGGTTMNLTALAQGGDEQVTADLP